MDAILLISFRCLQLLCTFSEQGNLTKLSIESLMHEWIKVFQFSIPNSSLVTIDPTTKAFAYTAYCKQYACAQNIGSSLILNALYYCL